MYGLVRFSHLSYGVYPMKSISNLSINEHDSLVIVKHKGCKYEAELVVVDDSKEFLQQLMKETNVLSSSISQTGLANLSDSINSICSIDISRTSPQPGTCKQWIEKAAHTEVLVESRDCLKPVIEDVDEISDKYPSHEHKNASSSDESDRNIIKMSSLPGRSKQRTEQAAHTEALLESRDCLEHVMEDVEEISQADKDSSDKHKNSSSLDESDRNIIQISPLPGTSKQLTKQAAHTEALVESRDCLEHVIADVEEISQADIGSSDEHENSSSLREADREIFQMSPQPGTSKQWTEQGAHTNALIDYDEESDCNSEPTEFQDDSFNDLDYAPSSDPEENCSDEVCTNEDEELLEYNNNNHSQALYISSNPDKVNEFEETVNMNERISGEFLDNVLNNEEIIDDAQLTIDKSQGAKGDKKENFCFFCHKKLQKIARHLEFKHKDEKDVRAFLIFPKGHPERREAIGRIRKRGNFLYNTSREYNDGKLIVSRRPQKSKFKKAVDYKPCPNCMAFFSKSTLCAHYKLCRGIKKLNYSKEVIFLSKRLHGKVHHKASNQVRKYLIPALRDDHVVKLILYDELIIIFANKMCEKYKNPRHNEMIRQRMRLLGRFMINLREINKEVTDFSSIYDAKFMDDVMKAINSTAKFNNQTGDYEAPTVAFNLGTLIKQSGNVLITECIKNHDHIKKKNAKDFLKIFTQELNFNINRTVAESQLKIKRTKRVLLPSMEDVRKLRNYLKKKRDNAFIQCRRKMLFQSWLNLAETTLISIQLFNRRRPGELERILIEDFNNYQRVDESSNKDLFLSLSDKNKDIAKRYVRFEIRGKLNRTVPVILDNSMLQCLRFIIEKRDYAGVSRLNPYVFGIPGGKFLHLRACNLMRKFSNDCGVQHPERLRATYLRKHIATTCITLNLEEDQVSDLANFMGHAEKIHKSIYRQPVISRDVLCMSQLLEVAQGAQNDSESEGEEDIEEDTEFSCDSNAINKTPRLSPVVEPKICEIYDTSNRKRNTLSFGSVRRVRWNQEEKNLIFEVFKDHFVHKTLPSLQEIQKVIRMNPVLKDRTPPQVKTWISNQMRAKPKKLLFI